jgi:hypothetical protein
MENCGNFLRPYKNVWNRRVDGEVVLLDTVGAVGQIKQRSLRDGKKCAFPQAFPQE